MIANTLFACTSTTTKTKNTIKQNKQTINDFRFCMIQAPEIIMTM